MTLGIMDDTMALEIDNCIVVTARFGGHAAVDGNGVLGNSTHPGGQPGEDGLAVDEQTDERCDEVLVLFPECAELGHAQVFLVEAPAGVLRFPAGS